MLYELHEVTLLEGIGLNAILVTSESVAKNVVEVKLVKATIKLYDYMHTPFSS